jgi:hypothetical protein
MSLWSQPLSLICDFPANRSEERWITFAVIWITRQSGQVATRTTGPWGLHGESNCVLIARFACLCLCVCVITFDSTGRQTSVHLHFADTIRIEQNKSCYFNILIGKHSQTVAQVGGLPTLTFAHVLFFSCCCHLRWRRGGNECRRTHSLSMNFTSFYYKNKLVLSTYHLASKLWQHTLLLTKKLWIKICYFSL